MRVADPPVASGTDRLERGAAHVRAGVGLAVVALALLVVLSVATTGRVTAGSANFVVGMALLLLALRSGSRVAWWIAAYAELSFAVGGAATVVRALVGAPPAGGRGLMLAAGALMLVAAAGLWRAIHTPTAREWLDTRADDRVVRRRPRPLAEWRRRAR